MKWFEWIELPVLSWIQLMLAIRVILDYPERWWAVPVASFAIFSSTVMISTYTIMVRRYFDRKHAAAAQKGSEATPK